MFSKRTRSAKTPAKRGVPLSPSRAVAISARLSNALKRTRSAKTLDKRDVPLSPSRAVAIPIRLTNVNDPLNPREMETAVNQRLPHPIQFYFTEVSNHEEWVSTLLTYGYQTHSILRNFTPDVDPCIIIEKFMQTQLDRAEGNARRNGYEPHWIGVTFRAEGGEIFYVTFKPRDENRAGRIIGEFENFHQSARRLKLANKPVHLRITIVGDIRGAGYKGKIPVNPPAFAPEAIIPVPRREDNLCLPVSIVVAVQNIRTRIVGNEERKHTDALKRLLKNTKRQVQMAKQLLADVGLPDDCDDYGRDDIQAIQNYYNGKFPGMYSIIVFGAGSAQIPVFKGPTNAEHLLALYLKDGHYSPLKSAGKLFGMNNYCVCCEVPYDKLRDHSYNCPSRCHNCLGLKDGSGEVCEAEDGVSRLCKKCNVTFHNEACYIYHKKQACGAFVKCPKCGSKYRRRDGHPTCGERYCRTCNQPMKFDHHCHIQKMKAPEFENYRVVVWDVETIQSKDIPDEVDNDQEEEDIDQPDWGEDKLPHRVNTLCVRVACRDCIESGRWKNKNYDGCAACGPDRCRVFTDFDGEDPVDGFLDFMINELPKGFNTYAYSHNGGRFDNHFLMQKLYERGGAPPKMQATGGKIFQLQLKRSKTVGGNIYFRDSYMIMMNALDKLPEVFGFKGPGLKKMFFPYLFNLPENYGRQLDRLPHHSFYVPETMSTEKRQKFKKWYRKNRRQPFELCEKLVEYCTSDVDVLMEAMVRLRALIKEEFTDGVDLLPTFTTMAGLCQRVYRLKHYNVDDKTPLAAFTETGYHKLDRQSTIAMKWLKWFAAAHNVNVQTRESPDGEKRIGSYKVDGFIPVAERNGPNFKFCDDRACLYCYHDSAKLADTVLEFQGCAYHGCNLCFKNAVKCPNGKMSDENYARTKTKIEYLQEEHHVVEMWECQLKDTLKEEERDEMKQFFGDCIDTGPLDPRQAFFGGRTGPASLRYKKKPGYAIKYLDVCSLYPH
ncbi:hypothetical protein AAVH_19598, partial [Aphelenchoides avenae]